MNIVNVSQVIGASAIFILFCVKFYNALLIRRNTNLSFQQKVDLLSALTLWTSIYFLFLFVLRALSLFKLATLAQLTVISGFSSIIPLFAVLIHLYLARKLNGKT